MDKKKIKNHSLDAHWNLPSAPTKPSLPRERVQDSHIGQEDVVFWGACPTLQKQNQWYT